MNIDDFDIDGEIKIKVTGVKGRGKTSKVWRVIAEAWIEKDGEKLFVENFTQGLRKEQYNLEDREKLRKRLEYDYKELLSREPSFQDYYHDNYVDDEDNVADMVEGEVL